MLHHHSIETVLVDFVVWPGRAEEIFGFRDPLNAISMQETLSTSPLSGATHAPQTDNRLANTPIQTCSSQHAVGSMVRDECFISKMRQQATLLFYAFGLRPPPSHFAGLHDF